MARHESTTTDVEKPRLAKAKTPAEIEIKVSWCKGCGLCVDYCNREVLEMDGPLPKVVQIDRCTKCMQCEVICPDFALRVLDGTPAQDDGAR